jgi:type IV secretion system protein VirB3
MTQLSRHPVHRALTRPQMFAGVTLNFFIINLMVTTIGFLILKSYWIIPVPIITHAIGYFACLREPRVFDLWITKVSMCPRVKNYKKWGCNSYSP